MKADLILHNAHIYTIDSARLWAETVACAGGRVLAVGGNDELMGLAGPNTQVIDAGGRLVLPGITDGHVHLAMFADWRRENQVSLFGVRDFDELRRRVRQAVERTDEGQWVYGRGWDESLWDVQPSRAHLDDVAPQMPVVLRRLDLHTCWVNSAALERAGITREIPDPPKGHIGRDATGEPTGILYELSAIEMVEKHMPRPSFAEMQDWTREAIAEAHRLGVTGVHDQRAPREDGRSFRLLQSLRRQGELDLRVHMAIAAESLSEAVTLGLQPGFGDDRLWIGPVKAFADGSMGGRTALMLEPFEGDSLEGNPNNCGIAVRPVEDLRELARQASEAGFPLAVHAVGDRAVRDVIDVLSEFPRGASDSAFKLPHLIEHTQLIHPDDMPRLSRHGIVASMQPVHLIPEWRTADRVWGRRARTAYAFRSLLDRGTQLSFGSDAPYETLNPMEGIYAAVTRRDRQGEPEGGWYPEQRISVAEAIRCYTMGPALAAGRQQVQGSITPGKWADMVMLSRDIFEIPADEIADVHVVLTIFDGRVVYRDV